MANDQHAISVPVTTLWRSPSAVRPVDRPAVADDPDPRAWPAALGKEERLDLNGRVDSQLLLGEPVEVVDEDADWLKVIAPWQPSSEDDRGYPGWVPRSHVARAAEWTGRELVVTAETTSLDTSDGTRTREATFATVLPVLDTDKPGGGLVQVALPGGGYAVVQDAAGIVRDTPADRSSVVVNPADAVETARRFTGLQYLWAGMSAYGLDCSGIVHISYRALGRVIPRDAHDQAEVGQQLPASQAQLGDLCFFSRSGDKVDHVGFTTGDDRLLHAPGTGNGVVDEATPDERKPGQLPFVVRMPAR